MVSTTFQCSSLTPIFMSGADGITAELREPSFKGVISYWWRAANAHLVQGENLSELRKHEQILFGSTDQASNLKVYISPYQRTYFNTKKLWESEMEGLKYLWFFPLEAIKFKEGLYTTFEMTISTPNEELHKQAIGALWLAVMLGGFGNRARRGAGNLDLAVKEGETYGLPFQLSLQPPLQESFGKFFQMAMNLARVNRPAEKVEMTLYPNLSSPNVLIGRNNRSQWSVVNSLGVQYKSFRNKKDGNGKKKFKSTDLLVFGGPIGRVGKRNASPVFFSVNQTNGSFFPVVTLLSGLYQDNFQILNKFLESLKSSGFKTTSYPKSQSPNESQPHES